MAGIKEIRMKVDGQVSLLKSRKICSSRKYKNIQHESVRDAEVDN